MLEDVLEDEELAEKLDAIKYLSTLIILSPHAFIRDLISAIVYPDTCLTPMIIPTNFG